MHKISLFLSLIAFGASAYCASPVVPNILTGHVTESDTASSRGKQITISNLTTDHPIVKWPDGVESKLVKLAENPNLLVLQYVGLPAGSTDTIYIEKPNHRFLVISVGALALAAGGKPLAPSLMRGSID